MSHAIRQSSSSSSSENGNGHHYDNGNGNGNGDGRKKNVPEPKLQYVAKKSELVEKVRPMMEELQVTHEEPVIARPTQPGSIGASIRLRTNAYGIEFLASTIV